MAANRHVEEVAAGVVHERTEFEGGDLDLGADQAVAGGLVGDGAGDDARSRSGRVGGKRPRHDERCRERQDRAERGLEEALRERRTTGEGRRVVGHSRKGVENEGRARGFGMNARVKFSDRESWLLGPARPEQICARQLARRSLAARRVPFRVFL